ncbi:MAG TPA: hypothetical protein VGZ32_00735 [Actinocrinis sp.]|jgi:hypothetical protein|uniref:hypothetical protein n=1 Tax=Actinocrinis sp. TaxID=1920516 RepID=UPI002DDD7ADB|nr:hypothetical protein [Actinocrinis sp.]HEV3168827.1 hypothetical protein [Actinocrinis sp.]
MFKRIMVAATTATAIVTGLALAGAANVPSAMAAAVHPQCGASNWVQGCDW